MNTPFPASTIIFDVQTAKAIDNEFLPTELTNTFAVKQVIYATYKTDTHGQDGYVEAKWYGNGDIQKTRIQPYNAGATQGFFSSVYDTPISGKVESYWCTASDCSDEQLAAIVDFTVSAQES
ncbi:MAG: hypothetical protein M3Z24_05585 [Chloroflexota bacterium]|nr:hypothetical protein [Chloroflexota bacterium]